MAESLGGAAGEGTLERNIVLWVGQVAERTWRNSKVLGSEALQAIDLNAERAKLRMVLRWVLDVYYLFEAVQ